MNFEFAKDLFKKINIELSESNFEKFETYFNLLIEWNNKINLTTITDENDVLLKHFIDSCMIEKYVSNNASIIDVGTGAGFPGVPVKIIRDDIDLTLLDSLNKRINFLNSLINCLKLDNVKTVHGRAEEFGINNQYREKFDVATARAVANLATLSEFCLPFVKVGGIFICMKAGNAQEEIDNAKNAIKQLGSVIDKIETFTLPESDIERTIIIIKKVESTPKAYPRKAGTPERKPL